MGVSVPIEALPFPLEPFEFGEWKSDGRVVRSFAPALSDLFVDPGGDIMVSAATSGTAPRLLGRTRHDTFQLVARVSVDFRGLFDAGALVVAVDSDNWAKLCFECGPGDQPMVVSVVTRSVSDDANAFTVDGKECWLRVTRAGRLLAFHASLNGNDWLLVRVFSLPHLSSVLQVGFLTQSPTGAGCAVTFDNIRYTTERLADLRSGV